ncbi:MAG: SagB/ThcOx family dehydrogenase [Candidatus Rokubacteria bacterium]|nr:SagB/ThcOx family dehydrogenase [Candidatus Rokubacteria bacterium]
MSVARRYHEATAHSPYSVRTSGHSLDWDIKPFPFKVYTDVPAVPLPRDFEPAGLDALEALDPTAVEPPPARLDLSRLTALLYLSAGITRKKEYPGGGEVLFRAAASTGALYQTEVYVVAGAIDGLAAGVYHFCPGDFTLRRLREGDRRAAVAEAAAEASLAGRAATLVLSGLYWRNTWKYQARGFRHLFWDSGTMLANAMAAGRALGLAPRLVTGFADAAVNRLLGLDVLHEAALELVAVGPEGTPAADPGPLPALAHETMPLSSSAVDYPLLREMLEASSLDGPGAVEAWRATAPPALREPGGALLALPPPRESAGRRLDDTIRHRGSTRRFGPQPLTAVELATALAAATRPVHADVAWGLVDLYLIVNAVEGIAAGAYAYWPREHALEALAQGLLRREASYLCLEQPLGGDAAATIFFLTPLAAVLDAYGERGYRLVNLEAGLAGGRAYLTAYAQRFGATGLTFYDAEVVRFFLPHAAAREAIFVTALGRAAREGDPRLLSIAPSR